MPLKSVVGAMMRNSDTKDVDGGGSVTEEGYETLYRRRVGRV